MLTQERLKEVLNYNPINGEFRWIESRGSKKTGAIAGHKKPNGYIRIKIDGKRYYAHRLAWCYVEGYFPEHQIDHRDRNPSHNWISNLRPATQVCNMRNTGNPKDNKSGVKGVYWNKRCNKWYVQIMVNGKKKYLGIHSDFTEAVFHRYCAEQCLDWSGCDSNSPARQWLLERKLIK